MAEKCLELKDIRKSFSKDEVVLKEISLSIDKGEFITLLGSSGCGKTTTLRIIAGLETPDSGKVYLEGKDVTALAPEARDVNTVFQNYALFPHMTVADNIGYGLKLKKIPKAEIKKRVSEMLELVQLPGYEKRKPSELSGGQRQRVAIARSLVNNPKVLLLDELLGALDLQLRRAMQLELKRLQKKLGITFIYITHDQEEAINMSDRIAVMNKGTFEQIGTPDEIYNHPKTSYVATFVGNANILKGTAQETEADILKVSLAGSIVSAVAEGKKIAPGTPVTLAVRSENMIFDAGPREFLTYIRDAEMIFTNSFHGTVFSILFQKKFYSVYKENGRISNLLAFLNLEERHITAEDAMNYADGIDYTHVGDKLCNYRRQSVEYLKKGIEQ